MRLAKLIRQEYGVDDQNVMFLRHSNERTAELAAFGATIEEYTALQDANDKYDFHHPSKPRIDLVVVIVNDRVFAVYKVRGVLTEGPGEAISSRTYWRFVQSLGAKRSNALCRLFDLEQVASGAVGGAISGWTAPIVAALRGTDRGMFTMIEVDGAPLLDAASRVDPARVAPSNAGGLSNDKMEILRRIIPRGRHGIRFRRDAETGNSIYVERYDDWLMTLYPGDINVDESEIEIAIAVPRLAGESSALASVRDWLQSQKVKLEGVDAKKRGEPSVETFRLGLTYEHAKNNFLPSLRNRLNPATASWGNSSTISQVISAYASESPDRDSVQAPLAAAVTHMLLMAKRACDESGRQKAEVAKEKRFEFPDDASFSKHVMELLHAQEGRCALSGLQLHFPGAESDEQMLASLDRIDSDGHYGPGNLQVVCRFINRWKSDERDEEFRRLLGCIRNVDDQPAITPEPKG